MCSLQLGVFAFRLFVVQILNIHNILCTDTWTHLPMSETQVWFPGLGRCPGKRNGTPLQYSCLGNPMDRGTWWATAHEVAKSQTWLSTAQTRVTGPLSTNHCYISISGVGLNNRGFGVQFCVLFFYSTTTPIFIYFYGRLPNYLFQT